MIIVSPNGSVSHVWQLGDPSPKRQKPKQGVLEGLEVGNTVNRINPVMGKATPHVVAKIDKKYVWLDSPNSYMKFNLSDGYPPNGNGAFSCYIRKRPGRQTTVRAKAS